MKRSMITAGFLAGIMTVVAIFGAATAAATTGGQSHGCSRNILDYH
jgi:hypothetical protein